MPDVKTSDETAAGALDGTELVRIVQGGNSRQTTIGAIREHIVGLYRSQALDADYTLTVLVDEPTQRHSGTLTADRTITLSATGAYEGARFHIFRVGGGAFNLNVDGGAGVLKALATDTWATFMYSGSSWNLIAYGAL